MALNTIDYNKTQKGPVRIYFGLAVPAASAELTLGAGGVPDPTENPNAKMVGLTEQGATVSLTKTEEDEFFDEYEDPLASTITQTGMSIKCRATQILDEDVMLAATAGLGTTDTIVGGKKISIGKASVTNTGIAVVAPTRANSSLYYVAHIYSGHNMSNIEIPLARQTRSGFDLEFRGVAITSRADADRMGAIWWETA